MRRSKVWLDLVAVTTRASFRNDSSPVYPQNLRNVKCVSFA